jgi:hypothetical protein
MYYSVSKNSLFSSSSAIAVLAPLGTGSPDGITLALGTPTTG